MAEKGSEIGHPMNDNVVTIDKRTYKAKNADDSDEDAELKQEEQKNDFMT
jgi:hypothetical protein